MTQYTITITNAGNLQSNDELKSKKIKILGDCHITNYDSNETNHESSNRNITIDLRNDKSSIIKGKSSFGTADFNKDIFTLLNDIANLHDDDGKKGNETILSFEDIKKYQELESYKNNKISVSKDFSNGVIRFHIGEKTLLRIDFGVFNKKEKTENTGSASNTKSSEAKNNNDTVKTNTNSSGSLAFLEALGGQETRGIENPYSHKNRLGYVGRYQMGEQAMVEMGIYKDEDSINNDSDSKNNNYDNDWNGIFIKNKYGITSLWDYRNSPEKQHALQIDYKKHDWQYIKNLNLDKYLGKTLNGTVITASGLLAGAHLLGVGNLKTYLCSNGEKIPKDGNGVPITKYIAQFANYDVSEITG